MSHVAPHRWADALAGTLDDAERATMDRHAEGCARCAKARARVTRASQTFPTIRAQPAPEIGWDSIRARVHWSVSTAKRARVRPPLRRVHFVVGGAVLAAGVLGVVIGTHRSSESSPVATHDPVTSAPIAAAPAAAAITGLVSRVAGDVMIDGVRPDRAFERTLGAGTVLATGDGRIDVQFGEASAFALGPRSTLEIRKFDAETIELAVEGTVDLEVAPRTKGQRFFVVAGDHTVEVRGTQFEVTHDGGGIEVACRHGLVAVRDAHGEVEVATARKVDVRTGNAIDRAHAVPLSADELDQLARATPWAAPGFDHLAAASSPLSIATVGTREVRVDGIELGAAPLEMRVMPGRHTIEAADHAGRFRRAGWVDVGAAHAARFDAVPVAEPESAPPAAIAVRSKQLAAGIDRMRIKACLRSAIKQGVAETSVELQISVDGSGAVNFLNLDSDLPSVMSSCIHDVLADVRFGAGPAATWREKLDL